MSDELNFSDGEPLGEVLFITHCKRIKKQRRVWRWGQTIFNVAHAQWPDTVNKVRGGDIDPFHDDNLVYQFLDYLKNEGKIIS